MISITLTPKQLTVAERVGRRRNESAIAKKRRPKNGAPIDDQKALLIHIAGARCELAAAIAYRPVKWNHFAETITNLPDLEKDGFCIDVKGIASMKRRLIVQYDDPDHWIYVLVCSERSPIFDIIGWIQGSEAKQDRFWQDPFGGRPAYFIPMLELHHVE